MGLSTSDKKTEEEYILLHFPAKATLCLDSERSDWTGSGESHYRCFQISDYSKDHFKKAYHLIKQNGRNSPDLNTVGFLTFAQ